MNTFIEVVKYRNETLFYFGLVCFVLSIVFLALSKVSHTQVYNVNAWFKPFKFSFSTFSYAWAMAWFCYYLPNFNITIFNWSVIVLLGFEIAYIAIQSGRGQLSHYNVSTSIYATLYSMMAIAATIVTIYTFYVAMLFFLNPFPELPEYYLWAIRLGLVIFVIFSFEGFIMGSRLTHTIGGPDGTEGIWLLGWSKTFGDPRVAHFIGMHAMQILPVLSFYVFKSTKSTILVSILYFSLAIFTLVQALNGKPLISKNKRNQININK